MDDTISRKAAIDALWAIKNERESVYYTSAIYDAVDAIEALPSAERRGRWMKQYGDWYTEEGTETGFIGAIKYLVEQMPAADVVLRVERGHRPSDDLVKVVRCKDCKHYQFADNRAFGMPVKMCEWFGFEDVDDDDFCSRAERKEE